MAKAIDLGFSGACRTVDVETTGLDATVDRVVSVCVMPVEFDGETTVHGDPQTWLVNPGVRIPAAATNVHGIRNADVRGAPPFADVAGEVRSAIGEYPLVGHNVAFDKRFLTSEFKRAGVKGVHRNRPLCTMGACAALMYGVGRYADKWERLSLDRALSLFVGASRTGSVHRADEDVMLTAQLAGALNSLDHLPKAELKAEIRRLVAEWPEESARTARYRDRPKRERTISEVKATTGRKTGPLARIRHQLDGAV